MSSDNINTKDNLIKKIHIYKDNFTKEQLDEYENTIFTNKVSRKKRAELELARLKIELSNLESVDPSAYEEYLNLCKLLQVASFDPSVIDEIYSRLVKLQLTNNLSIRLYSAISKLYDELTTSSTLTKAPETEKRAR